MHSKRVVLLLAVMMLMAACSKSSTSSNPSATASASASPAGLSLNVSVDGSNPNVNEAFLSYFPATATVHPGDTVNFKLAADTGEPHTVTLGTLADTAVKTALADPDPNNPGTTATMADNAVPNLLPQGPGDAIQPAAVPCFIPSGAVTTATVCTDAQQQQPATFKGTEAYFNSGWLTPTSTFSVKLDPNIAPGTYRYMCLLHREGMSGQIVVAPSSQTVPSADTQVASGQADLAKTISALQQAAAALPTGKIPGAGFIPSGAGKVLAGSGSQAVMEASIDQFGPRSVTTTVNGTITWYVVGPHTISFNVPSEVTGIRKGTSPHVDETAAKPAASAGQSQGPPPSGPPTPKIVETVNGGSFDGTGFKSSGLILSFPPELTAYKVKFTKAGTYPYRCIIHPGMSGVVVVK
jgi:plastocyanin